MKPLVKYYQARKNSIQQELEKTRNPSKIVKIIKQETNKLSDRNSEYIGQLTPSQANIARKGLDDLVKSLKFLTLVKIHESNLKPEKIKKSKLHFNKSIFTQIITGILIGVISAALALFLTYKNIEPQEIEATVQVPASQPQEIETTVQAPASQPQEIETTVQAPASQPQELETTVQYPTPKSQLSLIILVGVVVGATLGTASYYLLNKQEVSDELVNSEIPELEVDEFVLQLLPLYLEDKFELIDRAVASKAPLPPPPSPEIEDHEILLEFLQGLLGDSSYKREQLTDFTLQKINKLAMILRNYGITAKFYEHSDEPNALRETQSLFSFEPSINKNRKEYTTVTPALLRGNRVILRGRVFTPSSSEE